MPADFNRVRYVLPRIDRRGYHALMVDLKKCFAFEDSDIAKFRLRVLDHCYRYGWRAACDAFGVKKSTLYDWKQVFEKSGKRLVSLVPRSTRPHRTRVMLTDPRLVEFVRAMRQQYGRVGKYKLKVFLDEYAKSLDIPGYGLDKIGKIIKRHHYFFETPPKRKRKRARPLTPRLKKAPRETIPGYLEMDSITLYVLNRKYYFITVIDVATRYAWCKLVPSLSSHHARVALEEFRDKYSYSIREIQTDNGSEFLGELDDYLVSQEIPHQFSWPRSPRINGVVERFNRTIQDEFLSRSDELYFDLDVFNQKLVNYLTWYNTSRPHHSLKLLSPTQYLQQFSNPLSKP